MRAISETFSWLRVLDFWRTTERFGWQPIPKLGINVSGDRQAWLQHNYVRQVAAAIG